MSENIIAKASVISINGNDSNPVITELNKEINNNDPKALLASSWAICLNETAKFLTKDLKLNIKTKVVVTAHINKENKQLYFKLKAYMGILEKSENYTLEILNKSHERCPVSKIIKEYEHISLKAISYEDI